MFSSNFAFSNFWASTYQQNTRVVIAKSWLWQQLETHKKLGSILVHIYKWQDLIIKSLLTQLAREPNAKQAPIVVYFSVRCVESGEHTNKQGKFRQNWTKMATSSHFTQTVRPLSDTFKIKVFISRIKVFTSCTSYRCVCSGLLRILLPPTFKIKCQLCLKEENDLLLILAFDLSNKGSFLIAKTENIIISFHPLHMDRSHQGTRNIQCDPQEISGTG